MQVFHALSQAGALRGSAICLGNFDGVHRGHQALFAAARALGPPVALTFEPHPGKVLQPQLAPKLITPLPRKLELFAEHGLAAAIVQPFDAAYAATAPEDFERALLDHVGAKHVVVGGDFTYGRKRGGTVDSLAQACEARGAALHVVSAMTVDGVVVSSSRVREYILEGRVEAARRLLGRFFDLDGNVVHGDGRGRGIGFPTANLETPNELRPAAGVYAARVRLEGEPEWRPGAANLGVKPTFAGGSASIEVHVMDLDRDLYGRALRLQLVERLRDERRFSSVEELVAQIRRDVQSARAAVANVVSASTP